MPIRKNKRDLRPSVVGAAIQLGELNPLKKARDALGYQDSGTTPKRGGYAKGRPRGPQPGDPGTSMVKAKSYETKKSRVAKYNSRPHSTAKPKRKLNRGGRGGSASSY